MPQGTRFVCFNGTFIKEEDFKLERNNRAFKYADGFFETMHYGFGKVQLYEQHNKRIQKALKLLQLESFALNQANFIHDEIVHLINANHYFKGARIRLTVFRSGAGFYKPETQQADYLIESYPLEKDDYPLNRKGLHIGLHKGLPKPNSIFNQFKTLSMPYSILASLQIEQQDDMLLINEKGQIIESTHSNLFIIKNENIITSKLDSGCLHGIMRETVLEALKNNHFKVEENNEIYEQDLLYSDEIFLTNAIRGVQWVGAYQNKRYDYKMTQKISKIVRNSILKDIR